MLHAIALTATYGLGLAAIHVGVTRGTGTLPANVRAVVGANAGTNLSRWWAHFTSLWFHGSWSHLGYNLVVLAATMPFALIAFGPTAFAAALLASPIAAFLVNTILVNPLARADWEYAKQAVEPRLVGASITIFAGAGMAVVGHLDGWLRWGIVAAVVAYEAILAKTGRTQAFVGFYHLGGFAVGSAAGGLL